jgi:thymidine kinase
MLSFHYGPMNAGKSVALLQQAHTYSEVDKHILLLVPKTMNATTISSRIGIEKSAIVIDESVDLHFFLADENQKIQISCVFIDESQFLTCEQVWQLANFSSTHQIPVKCFGLRTDFKGDVFPASSVLLGISDELKELFSICYCGRKATMTARIYNECQIVKQGPTISVDKTTYTSLCRHHWVHGGGKYYVDSAHPPSPHMDSQITCIPSEIAPPSPPAPPPSPTDSLLDLRV